MNSVLVYLFETHPSTEFLHAPYAFAFVIGIFVLSFAFEYVRKNIIADGSFRKASRSIAHVMRYTAIVGLIMTWTRIVGIPYISMRVWWVVMVLFLVLWSVYVLKKYFDLEKKRKQFEGKVKTDDTLSKYLPKRKKK